MSRAAPYRGFEGAGFTSPAPSLRFLLLGFVLAALLAFPSPAHAVTYVSDWMDHSVNGQSVTFSPRPEILGVSIPPGHTPNYWLSIWYDFDYDSSFWSHLADMDDNGNYDGVIDLSQPDMVTDITFPLSTDYAVYMYQASCYVGADEYKDRGIIVNNQASIFIANLEPTPVRIEEIGSSASAATLADDVLPVSVVGTVPVSFESEASTSSPSSITTVSVDGTLTVDPWETARSAGWPFLGMILVMATLGWLAARKSARP